MNDRKYGQIIKNISDTYDVLVNDEIISCKCRGKFRIEKQIPLVGDFVFIDKDKKLIVEIEKRKNTIIRPSVANITQGVVVTSFKNPDFNLNLLDKLLVELEINDIKPIICLTKKDLISNDEYLKYKKILDYYESIGYKVLYNTDLSLIKKVLKNNITVFMGQTGAGKSTLLNRLFQDLNLKTGEVSLALGRGKHTTRHVEIIIKDDIKVLDTPGFSALSFLDYNEVDVRSAFVEFKNYPCPFKDCMHIKEEECNVKKACDEGKILESRYLNYKSFIEEFKNKVRW